MNATRDIIDELNSSSEKYQSCSFANVTIEIEQFKVLAQQNWKKMYLMYNMFKQWLKGNMENNYKPVVFKTKQQR